jgi:Protein of unknown function (DUF3987)
MSEQYSKNQTNFPYEIFPTEIMILLENAEENLNYPIEYLGTSILCACSVAIGNTFQIKLKEGFISKVNLYIALVGNAGDVKSHPLSFAFKPIEKREKDSYDNYKVAMDKYKKLNDDEKKYTQKPLYKKQLLKDFTPESLLKIHSNNPRGVAILSDELFGWIKNFGRYSSSGEQEAYLSFWNGASVSVDRKNDDPIRLDETYVNIIGTIQTKILSELSKDNRDNNGFIERMLFALNEKPKPVLWNNHEFDKNLIYTYEKLIHRLYSLETNNVYPNIIKFNPDALNLLIEWQNNKRKQYLDDEVSTSIQAKYEVYAKRFSLIIQLLHWALNNKTNQEVELFAVENAIKLSEYFFKNAINVHHKINNSSPLDKLTSEEKKLYNNLESSFSTNQILQEGDLLNIDTRKIYRFLKNTQLFEKIKHGGYTKID